MLQKSWQSVILRFVFCRSTLEIDQNVFTRTRYEDGYFWLPQHVCYCIEKSLQKAITKTHSIQKLKICHKLLNIDVNNTELKELNSFFENILQSVILNILQKLFEKKLCTDLDFVTNIWERANESKIAYNKQRNPERYHVKPKKVFRESRHKNYERQ